MRSLFLAVYAISASCGRSNQGVSTVCLLLYIDRRQGNPQSMCSVEAGLVPKEKRIIGLLGKDTQITDHRPRRRIYIPSQWTTTPIASAGRTVIYRDVSRFRQLVRSSDLDVRSPDYFCSDGPTIPASLRSQYHDLRTRRQQNVPLVVLRLGAERIIDHCAVADETSIDRMKPRFRGATVSALTCSCAGVCSLRTFRCRALLEGRFSLVILNLVVCRPHELTRTVQMSRP